MKTLLEMWRYRRVWKQMIDLWEEDCKRRDAVTLQSGECIAVDVCVGIKQPSYVWADGKYHYCAAEDVTE